MGDARDGSAAAERHLLHHYVRPALGPSATTPTIALFERYAVGADHSFTVRNTLQMIMALEDDMGVYPFDHEPRRIPFR